LHFCWQRRWFRDQLATLQGESPQEKWTGSVVVNGMLARGNMHSETLVQALVPQI
jgi:hypothetical protein